MLRLATDWQDMPNRCAPSATLRAARQRSADGTYVTQRAGFRPPTRFERRGSALGPRRVGSRLPQRGARGLLPLKAAVNCADDEYGEENRQKKLKSCGQTRAAGGIFSIHGRFDWELN